MTIDLTIFLPHLILIGSFFAMAAPIFIYLHFIKRKNKRPPFTKDFLRSPGESLSRKLDDVFTELTVYSIMAMVFPILMFSVYSWNLATGRQSNFWIYLIVGILVLLYSVHRIVKELIKVQKLRLGLEGERAIGEELNQLMLQGYRVFHDIPKEQVGNIDHVVIGKNGIFAVETKAISKPKRGGGGDAVNIKFDGKQLILPSGYQSQEAVKQAQQHAAWLKKWLSDSIAETINVTPVVTIPGWFITQTGPSKGTVVLAGGSIQKSFKTLKGSSLEAAKIASVSHQLEQRCRTVKAWTPDKDEKSN